MSWSDVAASLKPYDPAARCPKCGNDGVSTEYRSGVGTVGEGLFRVPDVPVERMNRKCLRCLNTWWEAPLDVTPLVGDHVGSDAGAEAEPGQPEP